METFLASDFVIAGAMFIGRVRAMEETTNKKWTILKIIALVTITLPIVWFVFVVALISIQGSLNRPEIVSDHSKLPKELQVILEDFPNLPAVYHGLSYGLDKRGVLRIDGPENVNRFIETAKLEVTNGSHPMRNAFDSAIKRIGSYRTIDGDLWFASKGFGTIHQEIVDLYLLRTSDDKQTAIIYHYWTF